MNGPSCPLVGHRPRIWPPRGHLVATGLIGEKAEGPGNDGGRRGHVVAASPVRNNRWIFKQSAVQGLFPNPKLAAVLAATVALGIFIVDTATPARFAVAVLYVIVVLLAGSFCRKRGILLVAVGCIALTIASFALTHGLVADRDAVLRCAIGLAAIAITTMLVLRNERVTAILAERASLLDLTHDTVSVRDLDDVITYWNKGAEHLYGWSREEAVGRVMHKLVGTVLPAPLEDIKAELLRNGWWEGELVHTRRDGSQVDMASRWHLQRDREGRPVAILETNNDITDRKRAEQALLRNQMYLTEAQRLTQTGSFAWMPATGEIVWSAEAYRIWQLDPAEKPTLEFIMSRVHPDDAVRFERENERAALGGEGVDFGLRCVMPDGAVKHIHAVAQRRSDELGEIEYLGAMVDVTAAREAEQALAQAQAGLMHVTRLTTLGELTASIAHEVNQPLAGVITHGEACLRWLNRDEPQLDEVNRAVTRMIGDGRRASEVIRKLRALSKRAEVRPEPHDLDDILEEALTLVQRELSAHRVTLQLERGVEHPIVLVDRIHLQQVLINLVLNAIQAMDGIVDRPRELRVRTAEEGPDLVRIEVRDSGVGIDPEDQDRLFNPFFTTKPDGLGMGLSISRSIVEAHRGRIWVSGHDGPGASFHVTLPVAPR